MPDANPDLAEVKYTGSGRPKVPRLDTEHIRASERSAVQVTLDSIRSRNRRLQQACAIIDEANRIIRDNDGYLKALALSLALHEGARAVYNACGLSRSAFYQMTEKALGDERKVHNPKTGRDEIRYEWPERPQVWTPAISERAKAKKVRFHRDAVTELPKYGELVYAARVRLEAATEIRDELVVELIDSGKTPVEVGHLIGRDRSRVWHILLAAGRDAEPQPA